MRSARTILASISILLGTLAIAQAPPGFNYQAVVRDIDGDPMPDVLVGVQFKLHQGSLAGPVVFSEIHNTSTNAHGSASVTIGNSLPEIGDLSAINWGNGPYFLEVLLDPTNSGSFTSMGAQQLVSVPYALHSGSSSDVPDGTEVGQIMHWDGGAWVADSGLYVHQKRFGIGIEQPMAPLGIAADTTNGSAIQIYQASSSTGPGAFNPLAWNITVNPSNGDVAGFSIDDATSGIGTSRLFIADLTGNVGIGNSDPGAPLSIKDRNELYEEFKNGDIPNENDFVISTGGNTGLSFDQDTIGGYASRLAINSSTGHVGIGTNDPPAPLSIESRDILKTYFEMGDIPSADNFGISTDSTGFDIGQGAPNALQSRFFIQGSNGYVGLGTIEPTEQLSLRGTSGGLGAVVTGMENTSTTVNRGWALGHLHDPSTARDGAFGLFEDKWPTKGDYDFNDIALVVLPGGNVGINETLPYATLHVSRPVADPLASISLAENTGIMVVGPITNNIVADYRGIQARTGTYLGTDLTLSTSALNLQRLGGDILIHGDDAVLSNQVTVTGDGKLGVGTITPAEKVDIDGAIKIGTTVTNNDGTIRWTGTDFEGRKGGSWTSLTTHVDTDGLWVSGSPGEIHYSPLAEGRVGIGTTDPQQKLHVSGANDGGSVSIMVENTAASSDGGWLMSVIDDNAVPERIKTLAIHEKVGAELTERITILSSTGNVGINEGMPDTKLHVSRLESDPAALVDLIEGTGIAVIGPMTNNIAFDYKGIQARTGTLAVGGSLTVETGTLDLQRLGGSVLFHGDASSGEEKAIYTQDGRLGLGTVTPTEKLHIQGSTSAGVSGMRIMNTASVNSQGWRIGQLQDPLPARDGALLISSASDEDYNDLVIRYNGNVGINEAVPDVKLHVSRPLADPLTTIDLMEGTGIAVIGPITDNVVFDYRGLQARHGEFVGDVLNITATTLDLQPLGGDILIHGDDAVLSNHVTVTSDGKIGIGKTPIEKLDVNGAITIGNTSTASPAPGTIRFNGTNFEGWGVGDWAIFSGSVWEKVDNTDHIFYDAATTPRVGIGTSTVSATLHVEDSDASSGNTVRAAIIHNSSTTTSTSPNDHRIGLEIQNDGVWGGDALSKNVGLYVSNVSGQSSSSSNIAAVINGNTVIGSITGDQMVGTGGTKVLAIQNGVAPSTAASGSPLVTDAGIQLYSTVDVSGVSTFHLMNGDGTVVRLYRETALTPAQNLPVDGVYDPTEAVVINNMRERINALEAKLTALGLLAP